MMYQRRRMSSAVVLLVTAALVLAVSACGGEDDNEAASTEPTTATSTTSTTTTTVPPIGTPFETDTVLPVSGISEIVGSGSLEVTLSEEAGKVELSISGTVPVVNDETCMFCMNRLTLGPGAVAADTLFTNRSSQGVSVEVDMGVIGPTLPDSATQFIVAGDEGAVLEKVGGGFRLTSGQAWLVTDRSVIDPG